MSLTAISPDQPEENPLAGISQMPMLDESSIHTLLTRTPFIEAEARGVVALVVDQKGSDAAAAWCAERKREVSMIEAPYEKLREFLDKAHKAITGRVGAHTKPRKAGIDMVRGAIGQFQLAEDRKRRAEEERLAAEARKRDEDQRLAAAEQLEKMGNKTLADAIIDGPSLISPPVLGQTKTEGASVRRVWKVRMVNKRELLKFIAEKPGYENAVEVNLKWLETQARQLGGNMKIPGVDVYEDAQVSIRGAA